MDDTKTDLWRRDFLKKTGISILGFGCAGSIAAAIARASAPRAATGDGGPRWAMVVDTGRCSAKEGCTACIDSCHSTHNVPKIDNPRHEIKWIWKEEHQHTFPTQVHERQPEKLLKRPTLVLCNHCEKPPCARVCPTQATWKREDGIVMMDMHRCIGCRYCVVACPYGSRSFNWIDPRPRIPKAHDAYPARMRGVVEKCNFCVDRLIDGKMPACVEAAERIGCGALVFGDLNDESAAVARLVKERMTIRRKPMLGTEPHVFYIV